MRQRVKKWFFTPCVYTQITQTFQENPILDEKHIGPNINTIPEQRVVIVGLYLSGKAVALHLQHRGFKSCCGQCVGRNSNMGWDTKANCFPPFFLLYGALILSPFWGTPENAGVT